MAGRARARAPARRPRPAGLRSPSAPVARAHPPGRAGAARGALGAARGAEKRDAAMRARGGGGERRARGRAPPLSAIKNSRTIWTFCFSSWLVPSGRASAPADPGAIVNKPLRGVIK